MTESEAKSLHKRAKFAARKSKMYIETEDAAQEVMLKLLTPKVNGDKKRQTINQAICEVVRDKYGRYGRNANKEIEKALVKGTSWKQEKVVHSRLFSEDDRERRLLAEAFSFLKGKDRVVMKLIYVWGMTMHEVSDVMGISQDSVNLIAVETRRLILKSMNKGDRQ